MFNINTHYKSMNSYSKQVASGFSLTFANGNTISVQWGCGNYCDNRMESKSESLTAEIAIWNSADVWYNFGNDTVKGYCSADEVAEYIYLASTLTF